MESVTFNQIYETITEYKMRAQDPRLSGWEHNHYRKWLHELHDLIKEAAKLPLHEE